jgi:hypothetical protein
MPDVPILVQVEKEGAEAPKVRPDREAKFVFDHSKIGHIISRTTWEAAGKGG